METPSKRQCAQTLRWALLCAATGLEQEALDDFLNAAGGAKLEVLDARVLRMSGMVEVETHEADAVAMMRVLKELNSIEGAMLLVQQQRYIRVDSMLENVQEHFLQRVGGVMVQEKERWTRLVSVWMQITGHAYATRHFGERLSTLMMETGSTHDTAHNEPIMKEVRFRASLTKRLQFGAGATSLPQQAVTRALPPSPSIAGIVGESFLELLTHSQQPQQGGVRFCVNLTEYDLDVHGQIDVELNENEDAPETGPSSGSTNTAPEQLRDKSKTTVVHDMVRLTLGLMLPPSAMWSHQRNRVMFGRTAMQPSTAYLLARAACIEPGHIVLDPCCGVST
jgi:hypothetical protein